MSYFILKKMPLILLLLLIRTEAIADNAITIEQVTSGNNNNITVNIDGSGNEVDFSYGVGDLCSITKDVWVYPSGSDEDNLGISEGEAFLTIERALEMIAPEDDDPITSNLTGGTVNDPDIFAPSTTG